MANLAFAPAYDYTDAFEYAVARSESSTFEVTQDGVKFEILAPYPNNDVVEGGGGGGLTFGEGDDGCLVILDDKKVFWQVEDT